MFATFGAGCFWCTEAVFQKIKGVEQLQVAYAAGHTPHPNYQSICSGKTGHAEVCHIRFNPAIISYSQLLEIFWCMHDPSTPNRQGNDIGSQYRSIILYHNNEQKEMAQQMKIALENTSSNENPIITEIMAYDSNNFYAAEAYHQDYYSHNSQQPYCHYTIQPKLEKVAHIFPDFYK